MEEFKPQSSENILKKIENTGDSAHGTDIEESITRLRQPFEQIVYAESGLEEIKAGELKYNFSYSSIGEELDPSLKLYMDYLKHHLGEVTDSSLEIKNWRKLDGLSLILNDEEIDVLKVLPSDSNVFFCPSTSLSNNGIAFKDSKNIMVLGDMSSPISFVILLHEMGHIVDYGKMEELGVEKMVDSHPDSDQAENLRSERVASAFALKVIRPYIKDETMRHDVVNFLKYYALKSYNDKASEVLRSRKGIRKEMNSEWGDYENIEAREEENRFWFDAWDQWKQTEKYKEWKELPENKEVDEDEEFGLWRDWVEKTKYDFWKDIPEDKEIKVENFDTEKSPMKEAYVMLGATTPKELHNLYVKEEQPLFISHTWDYNNSDQIQNKIRNILESVDESGLTEDEKEWRNEILWFWYHHAISCTDWKRDKENMRLFSEKAIEYQDNPNILTRTMYLLAHDKIEEAQKWVESKNGDADEDTALEMIGNYKQIGWLWHM